MDGVPAWKIAELVGVDERTARRWKRGEIPGPMRRLLTILLEGELGYIAPAWRDWRLRKGLLVGPGELAFKPGEVLAIPFLRAQLASLQTDRRVNIQADWVAERWVEPPDAMDESA